MPDPAITALRERLFREAGPPTVEHAAERAYLHLAANELDGDCNDY